MPLKPPGTVLACRSLSANPFNAGLTSSASGLTNALLIAVYVSLALASANIADLAMLSLSACCSALT